MPSGHLIKRAELTQCRAGITCRAGTVPSGTRRAEQGRAEQALTAPSRRSFEAGVEAAVKVEWLANGPLVLACPTSFDGSPQPCLMAPTSFDGSPNEYGLAQRLARHIPARHSLPAAPARHRSLAKPAPRSGFFPGFFFSKLSSNPTVSAIRQWANLPGIGASSLPSLRRPEVGILPTRSGFRLRSTPRSVFRLRFSFRFCPKNPAEAMRWGAHRFRSGFHPEKPITGGLGAMLSSQHRSQSVFFHHSHAQPSILAWAQDCSLNPGVATGLPEKPITGPAPEVRQQGCPCSIADRVFFHHSHALPSILLWQQDCSTQSCWQQTPPNPAAATGLPLSILGWAQDCFTQSCCGNCTTSSSGLDLFFPSTGL